MICVCELLQDTQTVIMMYYDDTKSASHSCPHRSADHSNNSPTMSAWSTASLPHDNVKWNVFCQSGRVEFKSLYYLILKRVINWCPSLSPLYPIFTAGILSFSCFFVVFTVLCDALSYSLHYVAILSVHFLFLLAKKFEFSVDGSVSCNWMLK